LAPGIPCPSTQRTTPGALASENAFSSSIVKRAGAAVIFAGFAAGVAGFAAGVAGVAAGAGFAAAGGFAAGFAGPGAAFVGFVALGGSTALRGFVAMISLLPAQFRVYPARETLSRAMRGQVKEVVRLNLASVGCDGARLRWMLPLVRELGAALWSWACLVAAQHVGTTSA
jgi:hypothetical protein